MTAEESPKKTFEAFLAGVPEAPVSAASELRAGGAVDSESADPAEETPPDPKAAPALGNKLATAPSASSTTKPNVRNQLKTSGSSKPDGLDPVVGGGAAPPDLAAIKKALRSGDLETLGELLDEDPAGFDEKTPKWAARNRRESKLRTENAEITAKAERVVQRYSTADALAARVAGGDFAALPELVQHMTGQDWDSASIKAFRAVRNADPRVATLTKRVAELEPVAADRETERTRAVDRAFYETLRDEVDAKDVIRKVEDWESKVATVLRESIDPDLGEPALSVKQAAARVVRREKEEYTKRAAIFGEDAPTARKPRAKTPERADGASGTTKRGMTRDEWLTARSAG